MTVTNYSLGDFLTRIKNAALARKRSFSVDNTKLINQVANVLKEEGYLDDIKKDDGKLIVSLKYHRKEPVLIGLKLISKPGLRIYMKVDEIEKKRGPEIYIVSTPKGVMSSRKVIKNRLGGEVLVKVW